MDKNIYNVFVNLSTTKISVATFKDSRSQSISFKEYDCAIDFSDDEFNYQVIKKTIEEFIFETEKITDSFLNDIYLMIDLPGLKKISLSLMKDHEGNKIEIKDIQYLVQDARQQILSFNKAHSSLSSVNFSESTSVLCICSHIASVVNDFARVLLPWLVKEIGVYVL